jgi:hypothetical protein
VVVCRPWQIAEAAIVLSCAPAGATPPLIAIPPPPISDDTYRARYAAYVAVRNKRDGLSGAPIASAMADAKQRLAANAETARLAETLTEYRTWWQRQRLIAELLATLAPSRALLLFEPEEADLTFLNAVPMSRISDRRKPVLPPDCVRFSLATVPLEGLTKAAWLAWGRSGVPDQGLAAPPGNEVAWIAALALARAQAAPLRADLRAKTRGLPIVVEPRAGVVQEAMLIEAPGDGAAALMAVMYAEMRQARVVLTAASSTEAVDRALAAIDLPLRQAKLFGRIGAFLFDDPAVDDGITAIERAVAAVVPSSVIKAVGDLPLTVLTGGIPYNFLRTWTADWSHKPIGHLAGDAGLLLLTEICRPAGTDADLPVGVSLLFDTGKFATSESADVSAILKHRVSVPLVLERGAATGLTLLQLVETLPIDLLFFNTHGSDREIELADGRLPAAMIQQRCDLRSRPIIFNSSCLSWVGVGRAFIRAGASGYIGTLWSVDAVEAAKLAHVTVARVVKEGWPMARAVRDTGAAPQTERAYIYVGTCGGRLADSAPMTRVDRLLGGAGALLRSLNVSLSRLGGVAREPVVTLLEDRLWEICANWLAEHDRLRPEPSVARLEAGIEQLTAVSYLIQRKSSLFDDAWSIATAIEEGLAKLGTIPEEPRLRFQLRHMSGRIVRSQGATRPAIDTLRQAADEATQDGIAPGPALLELSDALRADGRLPEAMRAAEQSLAAFEEPSQRLLALGRLTQTAAALGQHQAALAHAREGLNLATSLDAIREEAAFKGDEARILLRLNDPSAESAARDFLQLARQAHDAASELAAVGVLAGALMARGETVEAETLIDVGLQFAQGTGNARSAADFLRDKGRLATLCNNPFAAMQAYLQLAVALAPLGEWYRLRAALGEAEQAYEGALSAPGPAWKATWLKLSAQAGLLPVVPDDIQRDIAVDTIKRLQAVLAREGLDALRDDLGEFATEVTALMRLKAPKALFAQFLIEAMAIFKAVSSAQWQEAARLAADLDRRSVPKFGLEQMVDRLARN